jgi:hypothetical protein
LFKITTEADVLLKAAPFDSSNAAAVTGYVRRNAGLTITTRDLVRLRQATPPSVADRASDVLLSFAREYPCPGLPFNDPVPAINETLNRLRPHIEARIFPANAISSYAAELRWLAIASAQGPSDLRWLITDVLAAKSQIEFTKRQKVLEGSAYSQLLITAEGWAEIERLRRPNADSRFGFVAMSFHSDLAELYEAGLSQGILKAGYQPLRIRSDRAQQPN